MTIIDDYFHQHLEDIFFLEVKDNNGLGLPSQLPLPIVRQDFASSIEDQAFDEEISVRYFVRGMIFLLAMDPTFVHGPAYQDLLASWLGEDLGRAIFFQGLARLKAPLEAAYYFRANKLLGDQSLNNEFFYYYCLKEVELDRDQVWPLVFEAFNGLVKRAPHFPLAYYGLAEMEWGQQNYIKADLYYREALEKMDFAELPLDLEQALAEDIKEKRQLIRGDRTLQEARQAMEEGRLQRSLDLLEDLDQDSAIVNYFLGRNYLMAGNLDQAEAYLVQAYALGYRQASYYLDHSYVEFHLGDAQEALRILDEGLKAYEDEENLLYNRAMVYLALDQRAAALEDLKTIVSYDDSNENIFNQAMSLIEELR